MRLGKPNFISWTAIILAAVLAIFFVYVAHPPFRLWITSLGGGVIGTVIATLGGWWAGITAHPVWVTWIGSPKPLAIAIFFLGGILITELLFRRKLYEPLRSRLYSDTRLSDLPLGTAVTQQGQYNPQHTQPMAPATPVNPNQKPEEGK